MCESDDTDILLLIPPDYYVVNSTDDSLGNTPRLASHPHMEPLQASVVNKLVSQVNTIQNRLSIIESQSESVDNSPVKSSKNKTPVKRRIPKYRGNITLSNENLKYTPSPQVTPKKSTRRSKMYSLPSSPSITSTDFDEFLNNTTAISQKAKPNSETPNLSTRYDPSGNSIDSLNVSFSPPKKRGSNLTLREIDERYRPVKETVKFVESEEDDGSDMENLKHAYENQAILTEIQTFLQCVDCIKSHISGKDSPDSSVDLSFITSPQFKAIAQRHFNRKVLTNHVKDTKIKKISQKPKISRIQQFLEDNSSQNIQIPPNFSVLDTTNSTTISLMDNNQSKSVNNTLNETSKTDPIKEVNDPKSVKPSTSVQMLLEPKQFTDLSSENGLRANNSGKSVESSTENVMKDALYRLDNIQISNNNEKETENKISSDKQLSEQKQLDSAGLMLVNKLIEVQKEIENKENQQNNEQNLENDNKYLENFKQFHLILRSIQSHFDKKKIEETTKSEPAITIPNTALVSLSSLWNVQQLDMERNQNSALSQSSAIPSITQKIEEERYRREHCERLIEALQIRLLESQEKLSVALKVDAAKDQAIEKLKDTCVIAQERCKKIESDKEAAINELKEIQKRLVAESDDTNKKIKYYEHEINKALEVAHASQNEARQLQSQMETLKKDLENSINENVKLSEKVNQLQTDVENDKQLMSEIRNAASETKNMITTSQTEINKLQEERQQLQRKLSEEKAKNSQLENETKNVKQLLEESKQNEKKLTLEKQNLIAEMERTKSELRLFYQKQVDTLVKDKREEYQAQLDSVEKTINERISAEKLEVAKTAAQFMRETVEKHKLEIRLLEERHKEEIRLYTIKHQQNEITIQSLTSKLHRQQLSRAKLASKLHDLIESQWREALKIVTANGGSPINGSNLSLARPDSSINIQKLLDLNLGDEFLKPDLDTRFDVKKSYHNRPNSAPDELPTSDRSKSTGCLINKPDLMGMKKIWPAPSSSVISEQSDIPFGNEDQATYRSINSRPMNVPNRDGSDETPITTRSSSQKLSKNIFSDGELQLYMKMLLEENEFSKPSSIGLNQRDPASGDYKEPAGSKNSNDNFNVPKTNKDPKGSKPPWK